jgi:hypothetical protein
MPISVLTIISDGIELFLHDWRGRAPRPLPTTRKETDEFQTGNLYLCPIALCAEGAMRVRLICQVDESIDLVRAKDRNPRLLRVHRDDPRPLPEEAAAVPVQRGD